LQLVTYRKTVDIV